MANADMDSNDILNRRLRIARIGVIIAFVIVIMIIFANLVMSMGSLFSGGPGDNDNNDGPGDYDNQDGPVDNNDPYTVPSTTTIKAVLATTCN